MGDATTTSIRCNVNIAVLQDTPAINPVLAHASAKNRGSQAKNDNLFILYQAGEN